MHSRVWQIIAGLIAVALLVWIGVFFMPRIIGLWMLNRSPWVQYTAWYLTWYLAPVTLLLATIWLWKYWGRPPVHPWGKLTAMTAGMVVAVTTHTTTRLVLDVLLFQVLDFEMGLGGSRSVWYCNLGRTVYAAIRTGGDSRGSRVSQASLSQATERVPVLRVQPHRHHDGRLSGMRSARVGLFRIESRPDSHPVDLSYNIPFGARRVG